MCVLLPDVYGINALLRRHGTVRTEHADQKVEWLTVKAVADRLSVSRWQVRKWMDAGQFDEIAVFGKKLTRISTGAYDRFVEKNRQASA